MRSLGMCVSILVAGTGWASGAVVVRIPSDFDAFFQASVASREALQTSHEAIILFRDGRETLILRPTYAGPLTRVAWIIPVPSLPGRKDILPASEDFTDRECLDDSVEAVFLDTAPVRHREITPPPTTLLVSPAIAGVMPPIYAAGIVILAKAPGARGPRCFANDPDVFVREVRLTVREEANLGPYTIRVFQPKEATRLVQQLKDDRFLVPEGLSENVAEYGARGWSFVVAMAGPDYAPAEPGPLPVRHLDPLAISFATPRPLYPLKISQPGAPPVMSVDLVILAPAPVRLSVPPGGALFQEDMPVIIERARAGETWQQPPVRRRQARSQPTKVFLDAARREFAEASNYSALICIARAPLRAMTREHGVSERRFVGGVVGGDFLLPAGHYLLARDQKISASDLYVTRFWGLLRREVLDDLVFELQPPPSTAASASKRETSPALFAMRERTEAPPAVTPFRNPWLLAVLPFLLAWLVAGALIRPLQRWFRLREVGETAQGVSWPERRPWLMALLGLLAFTVPGAAAAPMVNPDIGFDMQIAAAILWPFWLVGMVVAPGLLGYATGRRTGPVLGASLGLVVFGAAWGAVVLAAPNFSDFSGPMRHVSWVLPSAALMGAYSLLAGILASAFRRPGQPLRSWPLAAYLGLVAGTLLAGAEASRTQKLPSPTDVANSFPGTVYQITGAIGAFAHDNAAFPLSLKDLTSTGPIEKGLDSSGNPVPLYLPGGRKPYLEKLPIDPLSGRRDTWTYDLTSDLVVDSTAWDWVWVETIHFPPPQANQ
ncbi:MAG: DUF2330 domain-containing protein [Armatimonadetes bacterium]|nr:DUF2330 domain-containing protein [Armatimonadota bacterium]